MTYDFALVGGGLQNGLIALALRAHQPAARVVMIERGAVPGGNHTWCFHDEVPAWVDPLVTVRWSGYDVAFPAHRRELAAAYACVTSERLAAVVTEACEVKVHTTALTIGADHVLVRDRDGEVTELRAANVIDARGPERAHADACGWQKFLGQELRLVTPHGLARPMLMDATVAQRDGFRFMYALPLAADRVLVEDTYFSDGIELDAEVSRGAIADYVAAHGWTVAAVEREETGSLPLPLRGSCARAGAPLIAGYGGGWFHPVTGYSFPIAARLADAIARGEDLVKLATAHGKQVEFAQRLNRMLFRWFAPDQRYRVLERFYRLPEATVRRFYALELTALDRARILFGRPPRGLSLTAMLRGHA
ncbi:MAG: lycopene beta-cyclase CrtY [Deltaproteobacteria bacterium]